MYIDDLKSIYIHLRGIKVVSVNFKIYCIPLISILINI